MESGRKWSECNRKCVLPLVRKLMMAVMMMVMIVMTMKMMVDTDIKLGMNIEIPYKNFMTFMRSMYSSI